MNWNLVIALGDSLTSGSRDEYRRGYPVELSSLDERLIVINKGEEGETSADVLYRTYAVLNEFPDAQLVLLLVGTNDAKEGVPAEIYRNSLLQIIRICQSQERRLIMATIPNIDGLGLFEYDTPRTQEYIDQYNTIIEKVGTQHKIPVIDMTPLNDRHIDKVHFNNAGYKEMAKLWLEAIKKL